MTHRFRRTFAAAGLAAVAVLALSACVTGALVDPASPDDAVPGGDETEQVMIEAAWLDGGRSIGIVTEGSSTCVPAAGDVTVESDGTLAVTFEEPDAATPCTADFAPRVSLVSVPDGVDPAKNVEISVTGAGFDGGTTLTGVPGLVVDGSTEFTPSAGWTNVHGTFIVLLWGSSTCKEYITATEVTGAASVSASLSGIPADKVCTADLAPNPQLAFADGLEGVEGVELTLQSATTDDLTIPIHGVNDPKIPIG